MGTTTATTTTTSGTLTVRRGTAAAARYLPWWERGTEWLHRDDPESRERARLVGLVWSTRTRRWLSAAALREEDRKAAIAWTEARRAYHDTWTRWTPALG